MPGVALSRVLCDTLTAQSRQITSGCPSSWALTSPPPPGEPERSHAPMVALGSQRPRRTFSLRKLSLHSASASSRHPFAPNGTGPLISRS